MSWNIQDSVGDSTNKFEISEFLKHINENDIICLQETKSEIKLDGFISYNSTRKSSRSGGVCILAKNCLRKGITHIPSPESDDVVAIKFDKYFFRMEFDMYLVCFYISPNASSFAKRNPDYTANTFDALNTLSHRLLKKGELILCGDANARTGVLPDYISSSNSTSTFDAYNDIGFGVDTSEPRNNSDPLTVAPHCQLFLDFVINNQMKILNGRTLGDSRGRRTCHKWNGSSSVDYFIASSWVRELVNSLQVHDLNSYSDHCPLVLKITTHKPFVAGTCLPEFINSSTRHKWDCGKSPQLFRDALENPDISAKLSDIVHNSFDDSHNSNKQITDNLIKCLQDAADIALKPTRQPKKLSHKRWFDRQCHHSKRNLNRLACRLSRNTKNNALRTTYFTERNKHSRLIKRKKFLFLDNLNKAIEDGHILNWKKFKQLKQENESSPSLDKFDLLSFYEYFNSLYKKPNTTFQMNTQSNHSQHPPHNTLILNKIITESEVHGAIKNLKNGKSSSNDQVSNEILQNLNPPAITALTKVFNHSLSSGHYPWHTSIITPIYKAGNKFNPDNYRAIAVGSCMGKLFSGILLDRLLLFKELHCPDPKEQLGFKKGAQTNDHILTLKTVIDKYTKKKRVRLYICFVDLRKAFDTVLRDLLLHKISELGISGEFFNVLTDMYNKSIAKIKITNLLSPDIKIERGTEQGHPLSPDLFKIFIQEMSSLFKSSSSNYPSLNQTIVSHLLWADDLVLLSLNAKGLQDNLTILNSFCEKMGLEVNTKKTKIMTFCPSKQKPFYETIRLGDRILDHTEKYCYLGITFDQNGTFSAANSQMRAKALRALYGLKNNIVKDSLSYKSRTTLFDTLVKPVLLYGCQVLSPHSKTMKYLTKLTDDTSPINYLKYMAQDHYEKFHLKFIKWNLSVHYKSSNIGCWGDTGRYPLFFETTKLAIDYFERVQECYETGDSSLLADAFHEQKTLGLQWYSNLSDLISKHTKSTLTAPHSRTRTSTSITELIRREFVKYWELSKNDSPKLEFYNNIKSKFEPEKYLFYTNNPLHRKNVTKIRISAHNLYVERGRYETPLIQREDRWCVFCHKTTGTKLIEDELHVLTVCKMYDQIRIKNLWLPSTPSDVYDRLSQTDNIPATSKFVSDILESHQSFTSYQNSQDFHNNTGQCILL